MRSTGCSMTVLLVATAFVALAGTAGAEFGAYDEHDFPVNVDGESTYPGLVAVGPVNEVGGVTVFPYWPLLTAEVQRLADEHPDIVKLHTAGTSTLGLDLWMLEIADFHRIEAGDGTPLDQREVVWVDGGTHSNEYSGVYFAAHVASFLADEYGANDTATWIVANRHTWVMPMVNPDGSHAMGRLNAHGVNINRNYPVVWDGQGNDMFMNNRGPEPASEVETQINIEWFNLTQPDYYASVHCCGNLWLYPYGEEGVDPLDNDLLSGVCDAAFPTVRDDCGPIWSTIYPASGSSVDTAYEYTGAVAFGYEMSGRGALALWGQPFTTESVRTQEVESWNGLMHAFKHVHHYGAYPVVKAAERVGETLRVAVVNEGYGNLTTGSLAFTDGAGTVHQLELPPLAAGEGTVVSLGADGALAPGQGELSLSYVKRIMTEPTATRTLAAVVTDAGIELPGLVDEDVSLLTAGPGGDGDGEAIAFAGPLAAALALALVAFVASRRRG